jgi:hypothetical protein
MATYKWSAFGHRKEISLHMCFGVGQARGQNAAAQRFRWSNSHPSLRPAFAPQAPWPPLLLSRPLPACNRVLTGTASTTGQRAAATFDV